MPRTTLNIDASVLTEAKRTQEEEGKSLGQVVSELLAEALDRRRRHQDSQEPLSWISKEMHERVDLRDKEALYAVLDDAELEEDLESAR